MTLNPQLLIDGYLDETLSPQEHADFAQWLREAPENRQQFAEAVLLHDRLRGELLAMSAMSAPVFDPMARQPALARSPRRMRSKAALGGVLCTLVIVMAILWRGLGDTPASAGVIELNRLITASAQATDRTYQISVEEVALPRERGDRRERSDAGRPPKPPLHGAILHVRGGKQFVLIRQTPAGQPFVTGSNGRTSWAVRPDGPARVSTDLTRFNRDLPGYESGMPLINIEDGLQQLRAAYDVQLLPIESDDTEVRSGDEPWRLLVAVKKRGFRGPRRVEITYVVRTGQIQQLRFVEMPYGPERLTLRLTLLSERNLGQSFFDHGSHHAPDRIVEEE